MECIKCKNGIPEDAIFCPYCGKKQAVEARKRKKRANGMGTIIKKPGTRAKPWEAQKAGIYIGCYATRHEAEQALLKIADARVSDALNMTFSQVYNEWLPEHSRKIGGHGVESYKSAYKHCATLHEKTFRRLRTADFQAVIAEMEGMGLAKSTCEKVVQLFGQLSKWAIREEICHTNYAQFVTIKAEQKKRRAPFSDEQIEAIKKSGIPAADVAVLLLATGCRPKDLFTAELKNCFDNYFVSGSKTEAGSDRIIPVGHAGLAAYNKLRSAAVSAGAKLLIDGYEGNKDAKNFTARDWKQLMAACGIVGMTPYNCRHTYATKAVEAGVKPEILQKILGHADYSTTVDIYTHLDADAIISEASKVSV